MARLQGELFSITKTKHKTYRVHLTLYRDGLEEEGVKEFQTLRDIPRFLISIVKGKIKYQPGTKLSVHFLYEDAHGIVFDNILPCRGIDV